MSGRADAKKVVEKIGEEHGYIADYLLSEMKNLLPRESFDKILTAMQSLKHQAAASVKTTMMTTTTMLPGGPPSVTFHIYSDRIVASCNEQGFTAENVKAICSVGQSSKKQTQGQLAGDMGYTGEKGIGFKSVFMAAEKVHIQSGDYSFRFEYAKGDSGLGMTTPIWTDHDEALDARFSHITLRLRSDGHPGDAARRQEIILEQFHNIHDSILLFMKKLQQIQVFFYDSADCLTSLTTFSIDRQPHQTTVKKSVATFDDDGEEHVTEVVKSYIIIKHIVTDLAPSENRRDLDGESQTLTNGMVVLGFPIDTNSEPVLQNEHLYAFLPVRKMGFKFLIHADFVTQANREDIVTTSDRNRGLAYGVAEAFLKAVGQFLSHRTLQYQWMRYLPHERDYPWDRFWKGVIQDLRNLLAQTHVLKPAIASSPLKLISESRRPPPSMLDRQGSPLVPDIAPNRYLSPRYANKDLLLLEDYGLAEMHISEWIERVGRDLATSSSAMKLSVDQDWHSRVADLLYLSLNSSSGRTQSLVTQLELCPLRDGRWVSARPGPVYYPQIEGTNLTMPLRVDLNVIDAAAVANTSRKRLFDRLGVHVASIRTVREAILMEYQTNVTYQWAELTSHAHFLYLTHHLASPPYGYERLYIASGKGKMYRHRAVDMYIADGAEYGVGLLLPTDQGAPGLESIFIVADVYFRNAPSPPTSQSPTYKDWFHDFLDVRRHLRLVDADGKTLSAVGKYVAAHRPQKFLGFLQETWGHDELSAANEKLVIEQISNLWVLCKGNRNVCLHSTYFPLESLMNLAGRFLKDEFFPWLQLESHISDDEPFLSNWASVGKAFGLGYRCTSAHFLLDVLINIRNSCESTDIVCPRRIYELYICL